MKYITRIGNVCAILLMLSPLYILYNFSDIKDNWFWLICSICYTAYIYSIIEREQYIEKAEKYYNRWVKDIKKKINLDVSDKEYYISLENYIDELFKNLNKK